MEGKRVKLSMGGKKDSIGKKKCELLGKRREGRIIQGEANVRKKKSIEKNTKD